MSLSATSVEIATRGEKSVIVRFPESDGYPEDLEIAVPPLGCDKSHGTAYSTEREGCSNFASVAK